jgi:hypothetical protein
MVKIMRFKKTGIYFLLFLTVVVFLYLFDESNISLENDSRNIVKENPVRLQTIFAKTKIVCFGRFLIKVPETATVVYGPTEVATQINYLEGEANKISDYVNSKLVEVESEREFLDEAGIASLPLFGKSLEGQRPGQKIVFGSKDRVSYTITSYVPVDAHLFVQSVDGILPNINIIDQINAVATRLKYRREEEIPAGQGMCIERGFVSGTYEYERATVGIRLKEYPDVHLSIDTHKNLKFLQESANPKLLHEKARESAEAEGLGAVFSRVKVLREELRQLADLSGQEVAYRTPAYKSAASVHEFRFHSVGKVNDPFHPEFDIRLDSGVSNNAKSAVTPSINDTEALALWDMLIETISLRKPGDATISHEAKSKAPLGTVSRSGEICPQTGFWACADKRRIAGDRVRLFKKGENIPAVLLVGNVSLLRKLIGDVHRAAVVEWKLRSYEVPIVPDGEAGSGGESNSVKDSHA